MDRPRVKGLGGSGAGMLFDGGAGEWGGRGGKENMGEEMVLLLCQGMPLTEIEGYCFMPMNSVGTWKLWKCDVDEHLSVFSIMINVIRCTALCCHFLLFAVNYVLKVALRHGMREQLSVVQPCERIKVGQLLVILSAQVDNSWAGCWSSTWLTGLTCLMSMKLAKLRS